jgi:PKD repeat protein
VPVVLNVSLNTEFDGATISGAAPLAMTGESSVAFGGTWVGADWDFGNGHLDSGGNVSYTYSLPGTYTVTCSTSFTGGPGSPTVYTWTVIVTGPSNWWTNFVGTTEIV